MMNKSILKKNIDVWDPIELFPGCPNDEYLPEIDEILLLANRDDISIEKLANIIFDVFTKYFDSCFTKSINECITVAEKIIADHSSMQ